MTYAQKLAARLADTFASGEYEWVSGFSTWDHQQCVLSGAASLSFAADVDGFDKSGFAKEFGNYLGVGSFDVPKWNDSRASVTEVIAALRGFANGLPYDKSEEFRQHRDGAPHRPEDTCPLINSIQNFYEAMEAQGNAAKHTLETVRRANEQLRNLAFYWRTSAESACDDLYEMKRENEGLKRENASLKAKATPKAKKLKLVA